MNDNEDFIGLTYNDNDVLNDGIDNVNLENDSSDTEEAGEEESREVGDSSSEYIDYSELLSSIDGRLTTLETDNETIISSLTTIENNSEYMETIKDATGVLTSSIVFCMIIGLILITYNVLNNWFK